MKDLLLTSKYSLNLDNFWLLTHERKECNMEIKESILSRKTDLSLGRSYTVFFFTKIDALPKVDLPIDALRNISY